MIKLRTKPNEDDYLLYNNKNYLIYRKDGEIVGTVFSGNDIIEISKELFIYGIERIENEHPWRLLRYKKDYKKILNEQINKLRNLIKTL